MSSRDKTRQKLVGSMRKTKAGAGIENEHVDTESAVKGQEPSTPVKPAVRTGAGSAISARQETVKVDAYQSGGRVWPD